MSVKAPSRYLWKKFTDAFDQGLRFWTSEDGDACEWVIMQCQDWRKWLEQTGDGLWDIDATIKTKRDGFVERCWLEREYFDAPYPTGGGHRGWMLDKEPTGFPVFIFDPVHLPRNRQ